MLELKLLTTATLLKREDSKPAVEKTKVYRDKDLGIYLPLTNWGVIGAAVDNVIDVFSDLYGLKNEGIPNTSLISIKEHNFTFSPRLLEDFLLRSEIAKVSDDEGEEFMSVISLESIKKIAKKMTKREDEIMRVFLIEILTNTIYECELALSKNGDDL